MSILKFELKDEHIKLLSNLDWSINDNGEVCGVKDEGDEIAPPFGEFDKYQAIDLILNGKQEGIDLLETYELPEYSDEQKAEWDKLYSELPLALSVILKRQSFQTGNYKTKYHDIFWIENK